MNVRTFYANSMTEAIRAIKEELGPDAVILSSRRVRKWGNAFGILGSSALEVMAAVEAEPIGIGEDERGTAHQEPQERSAVRPGAAESGFQASLQAALRPTSQSIAHYAQATSAERSTEPAGRSSAGIGEGNRPRLDREPSATVSPASPKDLAVSLQGLYADLLGQGLRAETAHRALRELQNTLRDPDRTVPHFMLPLLRGVLASRLRAAGPLLGAHDCQKVIIFVGPSGVGKTTTIAKLAAHYRLEEKRSVAMVTIDNYRPAAVEQLRLYANVLGIDLAIASTCDEARACIGHLGQAELVLVDTPGFNPRRREPWDEWKALAGLPYQLEVHLVLSATTRIQDIEAAVARCAEAPGLRLLFTKLDETCGYGSVFEAGHQTGIPLSYWGTGPRVPEDLALAEPDRLTDLILGSTVPIREAPEKHTADGRPPSRAAVARQARSTMPSSASVTSAREHEHE